VSRRRAIVAVVLAAGLAVGAVGCGGDDDTTTFTDPSVSVETTTATDQPGDAAAAGTTPAPAPTATAPATTEPDAGDEEGIRVPADFTLTDGTLSPGQITVPPQLPIAVTVKAADGAAHEIVFATTPPVTVSVPAGGEGTARIPGQRKGTYTASIDGGPPAPTLVAVDDAGP